jgi:hypothetical protein
VAREAADRGWGLVAAIRLPDGSELPLYQPRHPSPIRPSDPEDAGLASIHRPGLCSGRISRRSDHGYPRPVGRARHTAWMPYPRMRGNLIAASTPYDRRHRVPGIPARAQERPGLPPVPRRPSLGWTEVGGREVSSAWVARPRPPRGWCSP